MQSLSMERPGMHNVVVDHHAHYTNDSYLRVDRKGIKVAAD